MRRPAVIASLICLNVALAAGLALVWRHRSPSQPAEAIPSDAGGPKPAPSASTGTPVAVAAALPAASNRIDWAAVESADLKKLVANLRAMACPPQTVQDIVVARVNKQFAAREAELKLRPEHLKPWDTAQWSDESREMRQHKLRALAREKRALLKELLGVDVPGEVPASSTFRTPERFEIGYAALPESKRDGVRQVQESFWDQLEDLERRTRGYWEPEDLEEYKRLREERSRLLAGVLTPAELEEFEVTTSETGNRLRSELAAFGPADEELRQIYRLRKPLDDQFDAGPMRSDSGEGSAQRTRAFQQYEQQLKSVLGEARYAEYQRSNDPQYRNLTRLGQEAGVSKESLVKAYDAQKVTQTEAARVRADASLGPDQRQQALKTLQDELDQTMLQILGDRGFQGWQRAPGARVYREPRPTTSPAPPPQGNVSPP
jgi:hypothetical protein